MSLLETTKRAYENSEDKQWFVKSALKVYLQNYALFKDQIQFLERKLNEHEL